MITKNKVEFEEIESTLDLSCGVTHSVFTRVSKDSQYTDTNVIISYSYEEKINTINGLSIIDLKSIRDDLTEIIDDVIDAKVGMV